MQKSYFYLIFSLLLLIGCAPRLIINTGEVLTEPKGVKTNFIPIKAEGKETITKGTEKEIDRTGFIIKEENLGGDEAISIKKSNIKVTIMHASFDFLKDKFGLVSGFAHPLKKYTAMHVWGPSKIPDFWAYYKADSTGSYQTRYIVPFHACIMSVYRNDHNKAILNRFRKAFAEGKIQPFVNDTRTPQEIKSQMENLIGEQYCAEYFKSNIVFYIKVENFGNEKIRLWPVQESVVIDNENNQYGALSPKKVKEELLSEWLNALSNLPSGKENPVIGLNMSNTNKVQGVRVMAVTKGLPAEKAGLMKLDVITKIDNKRIYRTDDVFAILLSKLPGDQVNVTFLRGSAEKVVELTLMSADDWPKPKPIKILAGGNVYPKVVYDGFLVFNTEAMFNNYLKGSIIKLIIPLIGTEFTAADTPIHSFDFEFDFMMN